MSGTLFVVATPLGNLDDLSPRAETTLRSVAAIACEDTRRTARLLARFGIDTPTLSCHKFNERERLDPLIARMLDGEALALVSDAGTPAISDPGSLLVAAAHEAGVPVRAVAGPSAAVAALSVSGFPGERYVFEGFLPHRAGERRRRLRALRAEERTLVLFEAPHRIGATLEDLHGIFGDRPMVLTRELTKQFEAVDRGTARQLADRLADPVRGEITLVIAGADGDDRAGELEPEAERLLAAWRAERERAPNDRRAALRATARSLGIKRAELFRRLVELGESPDRES